METNDGIQKKESVCLDASEIPNVSEDNRNIPETPEKAEADVGSQCMKEKSDNENSVSVSEKETNEKDEKESAKEQKKRVQSTKEETINKTVQPLTNASNLEQQKIDHLKAKIQESESKIQEQNKEISQLRKILESKEDEISKLIPVAKDLNSWKSSEFKLPSSIGSKSIKRSFKCNALTHQSNVVSRLSQSTIPRHSKLFSRH